MSRRANPPRRFLPTSAIRVTSCNTRDASWLTRVGSGPWFRCGFDSGRGSGAARQIIRATPSSASPSAPRATSGPRFWAGGVGIEDLSIRIDLLPATDRIRRARRARRRFGRNGIRRRDPARQEGERLRAADGAVLFVVDFFAIQAQPRIHQPHEVFIPGYSRRISESVLYGLLTPWRNAALWRRGRAPAGRAISTIAS